MLEPANTIICGMIGSGKTTLGIRYFLNAPAAVYLMFDWNDRLGPRLGGLPLPDGSGVFKTAYTEHQLEQAIYSRYVIYNPGRMFDGAIMDKKIGTAALRYFCTWARHVVKRGPGKKFIYIPEVWKFCNEDSIPQELAGVAQDSRQDETELVVDTQMPHLLNSSITGQCTELICFRLNEPDALRTVGQLGMDKNAVAKLPLGQFISLNRLTGGTDTGKVFG